MKVLVADDTSTNRMLTARILEKRGHAVTTVENGAAAIERLIGEDFDVVIMDIQMPVMSGIDAVRVIRSADSPVRRRDIPVVALSAYSGIEEKQACLNAGMNIFLSKPVLADQLAETCERWSRTSRTESPLPAPGPQNSKPPETSPPRNFPRLLSSVFSKRNRAGE